jgi:hypothetical protein
MGGNKLGAEVKGAIAFACAFVAFKADRKRVLYSGDEMNAYLGLRAACPQLAL